MHILSHHWHTRNLKLELFAWLNKWYNINWIAKVGGDLLHKKGIKVEDYCNDLVELNFPLDTLGLLVIARMFHNHIAIILKERIWTTQGNNDLDQCLIFLIYSGGVNFLDTCTGRPLFLSDHSMSDLENVEEQIDAINLCQSSVEILLKPHPARMRCAATKRDRNCANNCSTCYGLRSSVPKKPVKPTRKTRNSNKVLMNINLDSLLAGNWQKNVQKRKEPVVVVDSETETVESTDNELKKPNASGSNKEKESTEEQNKENENENIENHAMDVTESELNKENEIVDIENNENKTENIDVTENNEQNVPETENIENKAMDVTENNEQNVPETENIENKAMDVTENNEQNVPATGEPNKENETENIENKAMDVTENNEQNMPATGEPNKENETENIENKAMDVTENNEQNVPATGEPNNENETEERGMENTGDESSDKDVTDTEANKDMETANTEPEDNAMDVNPTQQNDEKGMENGASASDNTDMEQNKETKDRKAKPGELKEKDPILEAFRNVQSQEDLEILLADYNKKKLGTSKVSETEIKTQNGSVNVKEYGLLKSPIRKDRSLGCTEYDVKKTTIAELTKHIKETHPGFKYKCSQCERLFDT